MSIPTARLATQDQEQRTRCGPCQSVVSSLWFFNIPESHLRKISRKKVFGFASSLPWKVLPFATESKTTLCRRLLKIPSVGPSENRTATAPRSGTNRKKLLIYPENSYVLFDWLFAVLSDGIFVAAYYWSLSNSI